jgi:hypothetical protein
MPVPNAPAPSVVSTDFDQITVDLGASNANFNRDLAIRVGTPSGDPSSADIVDTIPGTTTTYTFNQLPDGSGLAPDQSYNVSQRFKAPGA